MCHFFWEKTTCEIVFVTGVTGKHLFCVTNKNLISFALANCLYLIFLFFHLCLFSCLFSFDQGEHEEETPTDLNTFGDDTSLTDKSSCGLVRNRGG